MHRPILVVISGAPGAGKTTLARALGDHLHLPVISRDLIKTGLHVTHRADDPGETHRFSLDAFSVFYAVVHDLLGRGVSVIAEAAFHAEWAGPELAAQAAHADLAHVAVRVTPETSRTRYAARHEAGLRHRAHADATFAASMADPTYDWDRYRITDPAPCLTVDATSGYEPGLDEIAAAVLRQRTT